MARLVDQIKEALAAFAGIGTSPALIGGLALAAHQVIRATQDVDFLADADDADRLHDALIALDYTCIHRSEDAANYTRGDAGLDLLYAHRPIARQLLDEAQTRDTPMGCLRVISAEGLIAFKLQAFVNDASRTRDLDDTQSLLRAARATLDMDEVARGISSSSNGRHCLTSSLQHHKTRTSEGASDAVLVGEAGVPYMPSHVRDPFEALAELMDVVEALCPRWPARPISLHCGSFRL